MLDLFADVFSTVGTLLLGLIVLLSMISAILLIVKFILILWLAIEGVL